MNVEEKEEFIILLLLENNCYNNIQFADYIKDNYDINKFNSRYKELLDKFFNDYALKIKQRNLIKNVAAK